MKLRRAFPLIKSRFDRAAYFLVYWRGAHTHTECVFVLRDDLCSPSIVHQECPVMGHSTAAVFYARPEPETTDCRVICVYQFQLGTCQTESACEPNESTVKTHENSIEPTEYFAVRVFFFFYFGSTGPETGAKNRAQA